MTRTIEEIASEPRVGDQLRITVTVRVNQVGNWLWLQSSTPVSCSRDGWRELCANAEVVGDE